MASMQNGASAHSSQHKLCSISMTAGIGYLCEELEQIYKLCLRNMQYLFPIRRAYYIAKHCKEHKTEHDKDGPKMAINR